MLHCSLTTLSCACKDTFHLHDCPCVCVSVCNSTLAACVWDGRPRRSGGVRIVRGQRGQLQSAHEEEPPGLRPQCQPPRLPQQRLLRGRLVWRRVRQRKSLLPAVWQLQREVPGHQKQSQSACSGEVGAREEDWTLSMFVVSCGSNIQHWSSYGDYSCIEQISCYWL